MRIKKSERRKLIEKADDLFRDFIRRRDKMTCQWCGQGAGRKMEVAHYYGRSNLTTRWDLNNACILCFNCHYTKAHREPLEFAEFWQKRLGRTGFNLLRVRKNMIFNGDIQLVILGLEELLNDPQGD